MRPSADLPRGKQSKIGSRGRKTLVVVAIGLIVLLTSLRGIAGFYTDFLWFDALGRTDVWSRVLGAKIVLSVIFTGLFFILAWLNLMIADRIAPPFRPPGPEEEMLARYHDSVAGRTRLVRTGVSAFFALIAGAGVSSQWRTWLLFTNRKDFGIDDPQFGVDLGFYVFQLPFLKFLATWSFAAFVIILIVTAAAHYLNGGIRMNGLGTGRVTPQVKVHLSVLLAVLAVIKAADYWLQRFELTTSTRGVVDGALYTDIRAQLPAIQLLLLISLFAVVLLVINVRRRGWVLPVLAVGLWAFVAVVMGGLYPAFVQRFQVAPNETTREAEFIARNISATRDAFNLDPEVDVEKRSFDYSESTTAAQIRDNADTIRNARLLDPQVLAPTYERRQADREFYQFNSVLDVDRYMIDGRLTQVVLAARGLDLRVTSSWERQHIALTHGYGAALAPGNVITTQGRPDFLVGGLPVEIDPSIDIELDRPQIYHGEDLPGYALVGATRDEDDYIDGNDQTVATRYDGEGGVKMGSLFRRIAFSLRFGEIDPLISNFVTGDTKVIYMRDVRERVEQLAPFLSFDADPYPVMIDGGIQYVIDAYTTTARYPYSQRASRGDIPSGSTLPGRYNYIRNSVKAVVDAYDGDVTFYVMPERDPIIEAWQSAFPDLFTPFEEMPESLRDHLRYPQDLFRSQTSTWASYQVSTIQGLILDTERWALAQDPGRSVQNAPTTTINQANEVVTTSSRRQAPQYALLKLPGEDDLSYVTIRSFVPFDPNDDRKELSAFMAGELDSDGSMRLVSYQVTGSNAPGPALVAAAIDQEPDISERLSLLNKEGSEVVFGELLLLPVDNSIVYVRPLYVSSTNTDVPSLEAVIAAIGEGQRIALADTYQEALEDLFPGEDFTSLLSQTLAPDSDGAITPPDAITPDDNGEIPTQPSNPPVDRDVAELAVEIKRLRGESAAALAEDPPDYRSWAGLQEQIDELLAQLLEQSGANTTTTTSEPEPEVAPA